MLKYLCFFTLLASTTYSLGADELVVRRQIKLTLAGAERVMKNKTSVSAKLAPPHCNSPWSLGNTTD